MYALAFWPAALTEACACERSGARERRAEVSKRESVVLVVVLVGVRSGEDTVSEMEKVDGEGNAAVEALALEGASPNEVIFCSAWRFRCASRMTSMSAHKLLKAVETFFWPVARCLFRTTLLVARRSSRWSS